MGEKTATIFWLLPALPLLGALLNLALGRRLERRGRTSIIAGVAVTSVAASFVVAVASTLQLAALEASNRSLNQILWSLFEAGAVRADVGLAFDPLASVMCLVITGVGALIHLYSAAYMKGERGYWRYFFALNLFVFAMLVLVLADNLVLMFVGWEGVGVCSYILIGFWFEDRKKARAAFKAFIVNRVGDAVFIVGVLMLFWALGGKWHLGTAKNPEHEARWQVADPTYEPGNGVARVYRKYEHGDERHRPTFRFDLLRAQIAQLDTGAREDLEQRSWQGIPLTVLIGLLLFMGAAAKSAQIPLYVWLPDAMAGPTPVSALIHAATMVTAGVYLVARLSFLFALHPAVMTTVAAIGAITAVFAACVAIAQTDLKRVLAYSTVSQLGLMFLGAGSGAFGASVFHLVTHAFFKACLFLAAGSVIYACHHEQDMKRMGGLRKAMPLTHASYLYACIAISGLPLASGFFSKDAILFGAAGAGTNVAPGFGPALVTAGLLTSLLTSFYMWRSYFLTFGGTYRGHAAPPPHESPRAMTVVVVLLAVGSGAAAILGAWPPLNSWLEPSLTPSTAWVAVRAGPAPTALIVSLAVAVAVLGLAGAWLLYGERPFVARRPRKLDEAALAGFYVDDIYDVLVVRTIRLLSSALATFDRIVVDGAVHLVARWTRALARAEDVFDRVLVDGMVRGVASGLRVTGQTLRHVQSGRLQSYVYAAVAGAIVVIGLNLLLRR